jgi:hypothetical protein
VLADLTLTREAIVKILEDALKIASEWLIEEMKVRHEKCVEEGRTL